MIYLQLFLSFLQIGMFSFGGGYAAMPLIQGQVVTTHGWLTMSEFTDLITISQITPGPIAVNSATFVGLKIAGIPGAVVATVGCILPSCIIVTILARLYLKYRNLDLLQGVLKSLRPAVVAMIASAGILILKNAFWGSGGTISLTGTEWSMVDEGRILIRIYSEGEDVVFRVEDNGVGMSEEQCRSILHKEPGDNSGIGIKNVNDRIKIYFGKEYGLSIESELDEGTTVIIRMPKVEENAAAGWEKV